LPELGEVVVAIVGIEVQKHTCDEKVVNVCVDALVEVVGLVVAVKRDTVAGMIVGMVAGRIVGVAGRIAVGDRKEKDQAMILLDGKAEVRKVVKGQS